MMLNPVHLEWMKRFATTPDGALLREVLAGYILEIKDDVLAEKLDPKSGRAAIEKLSELINKMDVSTGKAPDKPDRSMFR